MADEEEAAPEEAPVYTTTPEELVDAIRTGKPIISVLLQGKGYDFAESQSLLRDLRGGLTRSELVAFEARLAAAARKGGSGAPAGVAAVALREAQAREVEACMPSACEAEACEAGWPLWRRGEAGGRGVAEAGEAPAAADSPWLPPPFCVRAMWAAKDECSLPPIFCSRHTTFSRSGAVGPS